MTKTCAFTLKRMDAMQHSERKAIQRIRADVGIVSRIVDRQHVSESNLSVCRAVYRAFAKAYRRDAEWRKTRKLYYKAAIKRHAHNRDLYAYVMRGGY